MPDLWGVAAIATKFALYLGILTSAGAVIAALLLALDRIRRFAIMFSMLGLFAAALTFLLRDANLMGNASGMVDPEMLGLLCGTPVGTALMVRVAGLGLLILGLFFGRVGLWVWVLGAIMAIWSFNHVGHIAGRDTTLLDITLTFHLVAIALWISLLTPLSNSPHGPKFFMRQPI